jgi:hypothetical protein
MAKKLGKRSLICIMNERSPVCILNAIGQSRVQDEKKERPP